MIEESKISRLSQTEYNLVSEAIYRLVKQYPMPLSIDVNIFYLTGNTKSNICVIPVQENAQYRTQYIDGGFEASVDFEIAYKCFPRSDEQKIKAQEVVSGIMKWLENVDSLPLLTEDRKIKYIEIKDSFAVEDEKGEDGNTVFVSVATLTYKKKGML